MDYGQNAQSGINPGQNQDFFTAGAGTNSESLNNTNPENNLDTSNWNTAQEAPIMPEAPQNNPEGSIATGEQTPELGQVVDLEMSPTADPDPTSNDVAAPKQNEMTFIKENNRTTERLDPPSIKEINHVDKKLDQTRNIADYYNTIRDMAVGEELGKQAS